MWTSTIARPRRELAKLRGNLFRWTAKELRALPPECPYQIATDNNGQEAGDQIFVPLVVTAITSDGDIDLLSKWPILPGGAQGLMTLNAEGMAALGLIRDESRLGERWKMTPAAAALFELRKKAGLRIIEADRDGLWSGLPELRVVCRYVIEADQAVCLNDLPEILRKTLEPYDCPKVIRTTTNKLVRARSPHNLFLDLLPSAERWNDGRTYQHGLLSLICPEMADLPLPERDAAACDWLADVMETEAGRGTRDWIQLGGSARGKGMSVDEANGKAKKLVAKYGKAFFVMSKRVQAQLIGCHRKTWEKTPLYETALKEGKITPPKSKAAKTFSLTAGLEAITGEGEKDEIQKEAAEKEIRRLIAEQAAHAEPSPRKDDSPGRERKIHSGKRL